MADTCSMPVSRGGIAVLCGKPAPYRYQGWCLCYNHAAREALHYMVKERIITDVRKTDERRHYPTIKGGYKGGH